MSNIIAEHLTHAYGLDEILSNVSFRIGESEHIGLVGPNGEGKTTLMRIIAGDLEQTSGQLHRAKNLKIGYLPQDPPALTGTTIIDVMLELFNDLREMEQKLADMSADLNDATPEELELFGQLQTQFEDQGGYSYHQKIEQVLTGLGFERELWDRPLDKLSGGQRTRGYLAHLLLAEPDVLLMDEPTNHLDISAVEWLEGYLKNFGKAFLVVSHDRYFLDRVTDRTWEVAAGSLETYTGSYSDFVTQRQQRLLERTRLYESQQEHIRKTQEFINQHIAGQRTKEAQGRRSRLERFIRDEAIAKPPTPDEIHLNLPARKRSGDAVLAATDLSVGYDKALVDAESLRLQRGWKIAIIGPNGIGKTTLLRTLMDQIPALAGEYRLGSNVEVGYLSQTHAELQNADNVLDAVASTGCSIQNARDALGALLLTGDDQLKQVTELSGGQRSRVVLARLVVQQANLLFLDEPTNHLDIASTEILQEALNKFDGSALFVSHDRYLIQSVATHIWLVENGTVKVIEGNWDNYISWRSKQKQTQQTKSQKQNSEKVSRKDQYKQDRKRANKLKQLQREHEKLEQQIDLVEQELAKINDDISKAGEQGDIEKIEALGTEFTEKNTLLENLWAQWENIGQQLE